MGNLRISQSLKNTEFCDMPFLKTELERGGQDTESITAASPEVYGGGIWKIFCRAGDFADVVIRIDNLRKHLVIKDKIIRIISERYPFQHLAGESTVARVIL